MLYLGLAQSLVSMLFFLWRKPRHISNTILSGWFFIIALFFLGLILPEGLTAYIKIGFVPFLALSGPMFYFYVNSLVESHFSFRRRDLFHLLPFFFLSLLRVIFLPESVTTSLYEKYQLIFLIMIILIGSITFLYWLATFRSVLQHQKNILEFFSNKSENKSLIWVLPFMLCVLISNLLFFLTPRLQIFFPSIESAVFWLQHFNFAIMGYLLLYFGLTQSIIFDAYYQKQIKPEQENSKYAKSGLAQQSLERYAVQIKEHFVKLKPFTNPEYNLQLMSNELDISRQNLSQTINEVFNKNFYQLVNEYRVEEFKKLSIHPQYTHYTLFGVAIEAGFNSKSSFNRIFKEVTGLTPSQYIKEKKS